MMERIETNESTGGSMGEGEIDQSPKKKGKFLKAISISSAFQQYPSHPRFTTNIS
jgi:hypothetical protein